MLANLGIQVGQFLDRQQMRTRVIQSEKLASLGLLSAGVAHEINNPLAYVGNNLAVLERDLASLVEILDLFQSASTASEAERAELVARAGELAEECDLTYIRENIASILRSTRDGVKRVADIVQNLRGFARLDRPGGGQADVLEALHSALEMIKGRLSRRGIEVRVPDESLPPVCGSPAQLNQVFLNLIVNALQAIESTNRLDGRIDIVARASDSDVVIDVADNGCGIPPEVLPHIFDPFFTTKDVGDGTGLGLSITHGIVQDHGGRLEVESTPGAGTRFQITLPIAREDASTPLTSPPAPPSFIAFQRAESLTPRADGISKPPPAP
jgi:signal transduction histidine kinase